MAAPPKWEPPADPDMQALLDTAIINWERDQPTIVSFDTETTGLEYHDTAFCVTLAWMSEDMAGRPGVAGHYVELSLPGALPFLARVFRTARVLVAHNFKFDAHKLEKVGFDLRQPWLDWHDTEAMSHLDDEHRPKGLKDLAVSVLGFDDTMQVPGKRKNPDTGKMEDVTRPVPRSKYEIDKARDWAKKKHGLKSVRDVGYHLLPRGTVVPYAILDAVWTLELARVLMPRIERYPDLLGLYRQEMTLTRGAIYSMERAGMGVRLDYVAEQVKAYAGRCAQHELDIEQIVGKPVCTGPVYEALRAAEKPGVFNPASDDQVAAFFTAAGHPSDSYDADHLRAIPHPLAAALLGYRKDKKLLEGYFVSLQEETGADGVFHPSSRQHGTVSGRTSAGKERGDQ